MEKAYMSRDEIITKVSNAVIEASTVFRPDKTRAYRDAIEKEGNPNAKWVMEQILENAEIAENSQCPLCDDTGIPHIVLEVGRDVAVTGEILQAIKAGVAEGLRRLPGRPMAICGADLSRLDQSGGLSSAPDDVECAPFLIRECEEDILRVHVMMFGGGPAIRARTHRVFHKHSVDHITDEIVSWATEAVAELGCSPCTLLVGIGRSHFEATSLMLQAQLEGRYNIQSDMESDITKRVNETNIGPMGLKGRTSVLATFMKIGPQRASGVRIVCLRPACCFEPRIASVDLFSADE